MKKKLANVAFFKHQSIRFFEFFVLKKCRIVDKKKLHKKVRAVTQKFICKNNDIMLLISMRALLNVIIILFEVR